MSSYKINIGHSPASYPDDKPSETIEIWFSDHQTFIEMKEIEDEIEKIPGVDLVICVDYPHEFNNGVINPDMFANYCIFVFGDTLISSRVIPLFAEHWIAHQQWLASQVVND